MLSVTDRISEDELPDFQGHCCSVWFLYSRHIPGLTEWCKASGTDQCKTWCNSSAWGLKSGFCKTLCRPTRTLVSGDVSAFSSRLMKIRNCRHKERGLPQVRNNVAWNTGVLMGKLHLIWFAKCGLCLLCSRTFVHCHTFHMLPYGRQPAEKICVLPPSFLFFHFTHRKHHIKRCQCHGEVVTLCHFRWARFQEVLSHRWRFPFLFFSRTSAFPFPRLDVCAIFLSWSENPAPVKFRRQNKTFVVLLSELSLCVHDLFVIK